VPEDDLIARAIRQLAAAIARTSAQEVRADGQVEAERADATLGRIRDALGRSDARVALREIDQAIGNETKLSAATALRLDARSLAALASGPSAVTRLAALFSLRGHALRGLGLQEEAERADRVGSALASR